MTTSATVLSLKGLLAGFDGVAVCPEISFDLHAGEVLGIVGENGAGKTTMLRTLVGRLDGLGGCVEFGGRPRVESEVAWRRETAVVLDDDAWFPGLTVEEHLQLVAAGHGVPDPAAAVESELAFFALTTHRHHLPEHLSSGQRRRLFLAAAFVRPAQLLILDEPEQRLDAGMRAVLADRLREMASSGVSAVVVTHDPQFLGTAATRCLIIGQPVQAIAVERAVQQLTDGRHT